MPDGAGYAGAGSIRGRRIATAYPRVLGRWLAGRGIAAEVVPQSRAVEIAPRLGRADMICDRVSTGATLVQDAASGAVLMLGYMNRAALDATEAHSREHRLRRRCDPRPGPAGRARLPRRHCELLGIVERIAEPREASYTARLHAEGLPGEAPPQPRLDAAAAAP